MKNKKMPSWFMGGIFIFPVVIFGGLFLSFIFSNSPLWFLIVSSVVFEEMFESCCYEFSNSYFWNLIFAFIFWFAIGSFLGMIYETLKK